jgi:hypothetical protein
MALTAKYQTLNARRPPRPARPPVLRSAVSEQIGIVPLLTSVVPGSPMSTSPTRSRLLSRCPRSALHKRVAEMAQIPAALSKNEDSPVATVRALGGQLTPSSLIGRGNFRAAANFKTWRRALPKPGTTRFGHRFPLRSRTSCRRGSIACGGPGSVPSGAGGGRVRAGRLNGLGRELAPSRCAHGSYGLA